VNIFECVPNIAEGRDAALVDACARRIEAAGVTLAQVTSDVAHHRSVFTFFGSRERVLEAALALARVVVERIDLREHTGAHPRIGALDVLPFVPFGAATRAEAVALAHDAARRLWDDLRVPSFFYGDAAASSERRLLATVRGAGFEALATREDKPDVGDARSHPSAGAVAVGARGVLVAFNVVLASDDLALARSIARCLRERDGGLRTLRALGFAQDDGSVQVSFNVTDFEQTPLDLILSRVRALAGLKGVAVSRSELIGLVPRAALQAVVAHALNETTEVNGTMTQ